MNRERNTARTAETMKAAAVPDEVRTHELSLRRGAELLQMPYRTFRELMAAHRVPSIDYDTSWLDKEMHLCGPKPTLVSPTAKSPGMAATGSSAK